MAGDGAVEVVAAGLELDRHAPGAAGADVPRRLGPALALACDREVVRELSLVRDVEGVLPGRERFLRQFDLVFDLRDRDFLAGRGLCFARRPAEGHNGT